MPTSMAATPPMSMARITGRWNSLATRVDTKPPMPANAAWPSVTWPLKPVTHTIDTKMMISASMICG